MRQFSLLDHACLTIDRFVRVITGNQLPSVFSRPNPAEVQADTPLTPQEQRHIAGLMRINYTGEVCAQALYQGQSFTERNKALRQVLQQASQEEEDHLLWCQERLTELKARVSVFNLLWYSGSFVLGATAGLCGQRWNLGFLAETERQVVAHLDNHLQQLPLQDEKTRLILTQMRVDELQHAHTAVKEGAAELPLPIRFIMRGMSRVMTTVVYWC